jgi:peptide/nickel transport system substrate-binding protein
MRKYLCACTALVLMLAIGGCGASKGKSNETASNSGAGSSKSYPELHWGLITFPGKLDFNKTPYGQTVSIESLAVNSLMEYEPDGKVKPGLASSVEQPNPTTYVYHLRSVKFSDGKPMTAADVVFSLDRNLDDEESWTKSYWEGVASITAPNSSTVVVKLKRPSAVFEDVVAFSGQVVEKVATEKMGEKATGTPGHLLIGTGPWKFDSYTPEVGVQLSRNPYWTGPTPPAEKITVTLFKTEASMALALRSGAIDGIDEYASPKTFANIPGTAELKAPGTEVDFVVANTLRPPFNDVHVRRALAYATDAKGMIQALYPHGEATEDPTMMPADLFAGLGSQSQVNQTLAALPKYEFNLARARQELAKSAYPHGLTTSIEVGQDSAVSVSSAEILASDLAKIGITAHVDELSPSEEVEFNSGKTRLSIIESGTAYPDPEGLMSLRLAPGQINPPGAGLNMANYRNAVVDKLLTESAETLNRPKRLRMIGRLLGIEGSEAPYWPLYTHDYFGTLSSKYVFPTFSYWSTYFTPWGLAVKLAS